MLRVTPIAGTFLFPIEGDGTGLIKATEEWLPLQPHDTDSDNLGEFAGRACYQAWERKRPETATNEGYLRNILNQGHESVLEHASITFYVTGVSRSLTHELIRHRHLSFSELSQRYVDVGDMQYVTPPAIRGRGGLADELGSAFDASQCDYKWLTEVLGRVLPRKKAREAARAVMPNATETKIVVTGNLRAWRDVLKKRHSEHADAEIAEFAAEVLKHLRNFAPNSVQDIPDEPYA